MSELTTKNITVPDVYAEIFRNNYRKFILSSGRASGKTSILVTAWWASTNEFPDEDIVICQSTTTEIKDSIIMEIYAFLQNSGFDVSQDDPHAEFYMPKSCEGIYRRGRKGCTRIFPITDANGGQRTRGKKTKNKISLLIYEEAQKNRDANVIENSIITFIRQMSEHGKIIVVGNNETVGHWFVDYADSKKNSPEWCYIYANCFHIWKLLPKPAQDHILELRETNFTEFRRLYLGDINANTSSVVFPQFSRKRNYKRSYELEKKFFLTLIIGIDHAVADDTYAIVPVAILNDGTTQTLEVCYDDPKETNRTLAVSEQCDLLEEFLLFLDKKYGIVYNKIKVVLSIDCAASGFITEVMHKKGITKEKMLWRQITIRKFTAKKKYDVNLGIIKNAFAYNVLTILNEGVANWRGERNTHRLAHEIEAQRYKNGKLDDKIPNDLCDALEYGLIPYYTNCYNLSFPSRKAEYDKVIKPYLGK